MFILALWGCYIKYQGLVNLKDMSIYCVTVLDARGPNSLSDGWVSLWAMRQASFISHSLCPKIATFSQYLLTWSSLCECL